MTRPNWDSFYLKIAQSVSERGECSRRQIGAIIVKDHSIVGEGYNGAPPREKSCLEGACPRAQSEASPNENYAESGCHVIHAETNAMLRASWNDMKDATLYVTAEPCKDCWPKIRATGIYKVVWPDSENSLFERFTNIEK